MTLEEFVGKNLSALEKIKRVAVECARTRLSTIRRTDRLGPKGFRTVVLEPLSSANFGSMILSDDLRTFLMLAEDQLNGDPQRSSELERLRALQAELESLPSGDDGSDDWDSPEPFDPSQCG